MDYLEVGGLNLSKLILGTDKFGSALDKAESFALLDGFVAAGGNCVDTARMYANWLPNGEDASETCLGDWMRERGNRDAVRVVTKGGHPAPPSPYGRLGREALDAEISRSLACLQTNYVDIYLLHRDDTRRPVGEIMETLARYVAAGKTRAIGVSNWRTQRIEEANDYAAKHRLPPLSCSQIQWSLASATPEELGDETLVCMNPEEYAWYLKHRFPVLAFTPQAGGFFSKPGREAARFASPENLARAARVDEVAAKAGLSPAAVALSYIIDNPLPAAAIIGCRTGPQLEDSLGAAGAKLDGRTLQYLEKGAAEAFGE